jgi:hypothetical protein
MPVAGRIFALLFLLLATGARAATYSDSHRGFSLDLAPDWTELSPPEVGTAIQESSPDPNLQGIAGFRYSDQLTLVISFVDYPQGDTYSRVTLAELRRLAARITEADSREFQTTTRPLLSNLGIGAVRQIACFSKPPGFIIDYQNAKNQSRSRSVAFVGKERIIMLNFFTHPADFPALKKVIDPVATSFRFHFAQSVNFDPADKAPDDYTSFGTYFIAALLLAGAGYLAWFLFHRRPFEF